MQQENQKLNEEHCAEFDIIELTAEEALCIAGGPEVENEPTR